MLRFIAWRCVEFPIILVVIYLTTFGLAWIAPGSPFNQPGRKISKAAEKQLKEQFHAQSPWQFLAYYPKEVILHGDLGPSMWYQGFSVNEVIRYTLPVSITLGLYAMFIATLGGCAVGVAAALRRNGIIDFLSLVIALVGVSLPTFVGAGLLIVIFSDWLHWLPSGGWGHGWSVIPRLILPGFALALAPLAYIARLTRVSMLDTLENDYVRTARAKGLSSVEVVWKHAFRNAFLPVFTYLGPATAGTLTGSFVIEKVFGIPGLGEHFVNAVENRDQTLILGTVMVYATFLLTLNLLVDIGYAFVDPRIDITSKAA